MTLPCGAVKARRTRRPSAVRRDLEQTLDGVTMRFGVSTWHGTGDHMAPLMERADRALYISKEKGRNTVSGENECPPDEPTPEP